ncbi:MAG: glycosyltransferase family A protein [Bacteroidia bacterium]
MVSISVIVPCYNVETFIEDGLRSVLQQTMAPKEIICVDDCSKDNTIRIIRRLQEEYPNRIHLYINEKNRGATYTRNRGLVMAKGEYIQFFDADDILFPDKFQHQSEVIEAAAERPDIVVSDFKRKYVNGEEKIYHYPDQDPWCALMRALMGITTSNLYKREKVLEVKGWTEDLASSQEYELMFRMLCSGAKVAFDQTIVCLNRDRESGSITKTNPKEKWKRYIGLRATIFEFLQKNNLVTEERRQTYIDSMFDGIRILYKYDRAEADKLHSKYVHHQGKPHPTPSTSKRYLSIYSLFGFKMAELASRVANPPQQSVH